MDVPANGGMVGPVKPHQEHRQLCTIELIAEGHADRCPGEECAFWDHGCALTRIEYELDGRPDVAQLLVDLRRELEAGRELQIEEVHSRFAHILNEDEGILETRPGIDTTLSGSGARATHPAASGVSARRSRASPGGSPGRLQASGS